MTRRCRPSNDVCPNGQRRHGRWGTHRFLEAVEANPQLADNVVAVVAAVAELRPSTARHYDLVERVLPPSVLAREVDDDEAVRELTLRAAGKRAG